MLIDMTDKAHPKLRRPDRRRRHDGLRPHGDARQQDCSTSTRRSRRSTRRPATRTSRSSTSPTRPSRSRRARSRRPAPTSGLAHDTYIDHRPDGKTLMYAASIHQIGRLRRHQPAQRDLAADARRSTYTISHDVQPNHDRTIIVVDDEGAAGGQLDEDVSVCGKVGPGPASLDSGSVHFFAASAGRHVRQRRRCCSSARSTRRPTSTPARAWRTCSGRRPTRTA